MSIWAFFLRVIILCWEVVGSWWELSPWPLPLPLFDGPGRGVSPPYLCLHSETVWGRPSLLLFMGRFCLFNIFPPLSIINVLASSAWCLANMAAHAGLRLRFTWPQRRYSLPCFLSSLTQLVTPSQSPSYHPLGTLNGGLAVSSRNPWKP